MFEDDEIDDAPIQRVFVAASEVPLPNIKAPRSVFEMAMGGLHIKHGAKANGGAKISAAKCCRETQDGVTVIVGGAYPVGRMTQEKAEAEKVRRAKQRPPKPTQKAKTISKKFQSLVG